MTVLTPAHSVRGAQDLEKKRKSVVLLPQAQHARLRRRYWARGGLFFSLSMGSCMFISCPLLDCGLLRVKDQSLNQFCVPPSAPCLEQKVLVHLMQVSAPDVTLRRLRHLPGLTCDKLGHRPE